MYVIRFARQGHFALCLGSELTRNLSRRSRRISSRVRGMTSMIKQVLFKPVTMPWSRLRLTNF